MQEDEFDPHGGQTYDRARRVFRDGDGQIVTKHNAAANAERTQRPDKPVFLTLKSDLSLALDNDSIPRSTLSAALDRATSGDKQQRVFMRADKAVPYGELMTLMNDLRSAGYLHIALVGLEGDKQ